MTELLNEQPRSDGNKTVQSVARSHVAAPASLILPVLLLVTLTLRDSARVHVRSVAIARNTATSRENVPSGTNTTTSNATVLRTLRGHIQNADQIALSQARVELIRIVEDRTFPVAEVTVGQSGDFEIRELTDGNYWLVVFSEGRARQVRSIRVDRSTTPLRISLAPGATIEGEVVLARRNSGNHAVVEIPDAATDAGTVAVNSQSSEGVPNIIVRAVADGGSAEPPFATRTDGRGHFLLDGLSPGIYRVEVAHPGYEVVVRRAVPAPSRGVSLALRELSEIRGVVRNEHGAVMPDADVMLAGSGVWPPRSLHTGSDGRFNIVSLPSGVYELRARSGDRVAEPIAPLVLEPGAHREVELMVTPGGVIRGMVVDAVTGASIAGARVVIAEDSVATQPIALVADGQGRFHSSGLLRRTHQVSARAAGYVPRVGNITMPDTGELVVSLDRQVALTGRIVDSRGAPVMGAQVEVTVVDLDGRPTWLTASAVAFREALFTAQVGGPRPLLPAGELGVMPGPIPRPPMVGEGNVPSNAFSNMLNTTTTGYVTDSDGRFRIEEVPPGIVTVVASHPAYVRGETAQRAARAGESVDVEIVLHEGGTVDGRLVDEQGFPVPSQLIEIRSEHEALPRRVFTARDGTFRVPAVMGQLTIVALLNWRIAARAEIEVIDGQVLPVVLTLDRGIRQVRGRVLDPRGFAVVGADITITATERPLGSARTVSGQDGTFETTVQGATGSVTLEVRHPEFALRTLRGVTTTQLNDEVRIELEPGGGLTVELHADECAATSLSQDVSVQFRTACGPVNRVVRLSGDITLEHLCPGPVTMVANAQGCIRAERTATVTVNQRAEMGRVDLVPGGGASGEVVDAHGEVVPGAVISMVNAAPDSTTGTARSDRRGQFVVNDLPDGDQNLVAVHPLLGRSDVVSVRVWRGSIARGARLTFATDLQGAETATSQSVVGFVERGGAVEVASVQPDSAPSRAGLQISDRLLSVNGTAVTNSSHAMRLINGPSGDEVHVEVVRDGVQRSLHWTRELIR